MNSKSPGVFLIAHVLQLVETVKLPNAYDAGNRFLPKKKMPKSCHVLVYLGSPAKKFIFFV